MGGRGGGRTLAKVGSSARFELISSFALASQSSFVSINRNERPMKLISWHPSVVYYKLCKKLKGFRFSLTDDRVA